MFEAIVKVLSIVFEPLFGVTKDAFHRRSDPKARMTRALIRLYDGLNELQCISLKLLDQTEAYIVRDWAAWTVARTRRAEILETASQLSKTTADLGDSLKKLYSMLSVHEPELLMALASIHGVKGLLITKGLAAPTVVETSRDPKTAGLRLIHPKGDPTALQWSRALISEFQPSRWGASGLETDIVASIDIEPERERAVAVIQASRPVVAQIEPVKSALREFIKRTVSIEDFFQ